MPLRSWHRRGGVPSRPVRDLSPSNIQVVQKLILSCRVDRMVQLVEPSDSGPLDRLRSRRHDSCGGLNHQSGLRASELPHLLALHTHHAHPWLHQQHADEMDRPVQQFRIDLQHHCSLYCADLDPRRHRSRNAITALAKIHVHP